MQDTVQEEWFVQVVQNTNAYDAIVVLAHMDCQDPLLANVLLPSFRTLAGRTVPIVFLAGHTHRRCFVQLDDHAVSLEAGRFLDTIGMVNIRLQVSATRIRQCHETCSAAGSGGGPCSARHDRRKSVECRNSSHTHCHGPEQGGWLYAAPLLTPSKHSTR